MQTVTFLVLQHPIGYLSITRKACLTISGPKTSPTDLCRAVAIKAVLVLALGVSRNAARVARFLVVLAVRVAGFLLLVGCT